MRQRLLSVSIAALLLSSAAARAGDFDWSGFFIGAYGGAGAIVDDLSLPGIGAGNFNGVGGEGWTGGGLLGFDYRISPMVVVGVQADVGSTGLRTSLDIPALGGKLVSAEPDLTASASLRLGYLPTPQTLLYLIGGYSYARYNVDIKGALAGLLGASDFAQNYSGFHVGAGIETKLTQNLTGRIEYRYTQYGGEDWGTGGILDVAPSTHTVMFGLTWAFLPIGSAVAPTPVRYAKADGSWTGFYLGGYGGAGAIVDDISLPGIGAGDFNGIGGEGLTGGGLLGFNYQISPRFLVGLQGDVGATSLDTELNIPIAGGNLIDAQPDLTASASARIGFLPTRSTLLYVLGGYSYARYNVNVGGPLAALLGASDFRQNYNGFHVGAGIETKLTHNLTGRLEYRYAQYAGQDWGTGGILSVAPSSHTAMVGLSWLIGSR